MDGPTTSTLYLCRLRVFLRTLSASSVTTEMAGNVRTGGDFVDGFLAEALPPKMGFGDDVVFVVGRERADGCI